MNFYSGNYCCLEIFARCKSGTQGGIKLLNKITNESQESTAGKYNYILLKFPLIKKQEYQLILENVDISIAYLSQCDDILDKGVKFIEISDNYSLTTQDDLSDWYDTPYREQYHFGPYKNWINDPNGLCYYKGYYHMFYQANPHEQKWGHMYWGHAVSRDLVHWIHLPYVLFPQEEILNAKDLKGGAFSGCAVALDDRIQFYLTRHLGPSEDCDETVQYQTMVSSRDGINFGKEEIIIEKPGKPFSFNFRDPKVFYHNEKWKMVLGTQLNNIPAIVLYESKDMKNFEYSGEVILESQKGVYTIECPDLFELDGKFVAIAAYMFYTDDQGRIQPTMYYIGELEGHRLNVEKRGLFDFGSNYYAVQTFEYAGRRIAIGWISDFYEEHVVEKNGAYGSMALPRELSLKNNHLYMKPVKEVYSLIDKELCRISKQNIRIDKIKGNCYYSKLIFKGNSDFDLLLGKNEESSIRLKCNNNEVSIQTNGVKSSHVQFIAPIKEVRTVEIFVDRRVVEVFLNDGEAAGTKLFYTESKEGIFELSCTDTDVIDEVSVYTVKTIW